MIPNLAIIDPSVTDTLPKKVIACSGFDVISHAIGRYLWSLISLICRIIYSSPFSNKTKSQAPIWTVGSIFLKLIGSVPFIKVPILMVTLAVQKPSDFLGGIFWELIPIQKIKKHVIKWCLLPCWREVVWETAELTFQYLFVSSQIWDLKHGMSYPVSGLVRDFKEEGYPNIPLIPHGMSVILNAPAVFRFTSFADHERHLKGTQIFNVS